MTFDAKAEFLSAFEKAVRDEEASSGFRLDDWFGAGRSTPAKDFSDWLDRGPVMIRQFTEWFEQSGAEVWITPDGQPAIELELLVMFGRIPVHIRPDFILKLGTALVVTDFKSGSTTPKSMRQLGLYASGIELEYGIRPKYGTFYMGRGSGPRDCPPELRTYFQRPVPMDEYRYSVPYLTKQLELFVKARDAGIFIANPGDECRLCGVSQACVETGSKLERTR